ncbi:MAG: hypothetical protein LBH15_04125 [Treponema sp.]|jgi:hypothetical protein|nr:hypothetical protein [Treponema sp.]
MRVSAPVRGFFRVFLFLLAASLWAADSPSSKIEDDSALRRSLKAGWLTETPGKVLAARPSVRTLPGGSRIQVRAEERGDEFAVILARELVTVEGRGSGDFPGWAQGSWVFARDKRDGRLVSIRVFPGRDPYAYVQFRPLGGGKSQMDVVVYDAYLVQSHPLPLTVERIMEIPLEETLRAAGTAFPRRYFDPYPGQYRDILALAARIREELPSLSFRDDGAIDDQGRYVFINTLSPQDGQGGLNCSGFAKWVVDGILRPLTGELLPIEALKQPFGERGSSFTEPFEQLRDPFFGLDWTRNLASRANAAMLSPVFGKAEEFEVRSAPFGSLIVRGRGGAPAGLRPYPGFLPNAGFGVEGLQALLYTLAIDEPGRIYLASVNNEINTPSPPRMRQHFHVAVLVPYFNEYGVFRTAVFESAAETSFARFRGRYPGHYVNLAGIPVEGAFSP